MPRASTGNAFYSGNRWYARIPIGNGKRLALALPWCQDGLSAKARAISMAALAKTLRTTQDGRDSLLRFLKIAADATAEKELEALRSHAASLVEVEASSAREQLKGTTFADVAYAWSSGELARRFPDDVLPLKRPKGPMSTLGKHVLPTIGHLPMKNLTVWHARHVMSLLPPGLAPVTRHNVAQLISRVVKLAVNPLGLIDANPLGDSWLQSTNETVPKTLGPIVYPPLALGSDWRSLSDVSLDSELPGPLETTDLLETGVYAVRCGDFVKIGRARNVALRLSGLQGGSPHKHELLAILSRSCGDEGTWHKRFAHLRVCGEWFRLCEQIAAFIRWSREHNQANYSTMDRAA